MVLVTTTFGLNPKGSSIINIGAGKSFTRQLASIRYNEDMEYKINYVYWIDSSSRSGWNDRPTKDWTMHDLECHSVGWVIQETKELLVIAQSYSNDQHGDIMAIPKSQIKKRKIIKQKL